MRRVLMLVTVCLGVACGDDGAEEAASSMDVVTSGDAGQPDAGGDVGPAPEDVSAADSAMDVGSEDAAPDDAAPDTGPVVVVVEDAVYTLSLGGQVDQLLSATHAGDPSLTFEVLDQPAIGELLHFDPETGRFVYTSREEGVATLPFAVLRDGEEQDAATVTLTTGPLDFLGDWTNDPIGGCAPYPFSIVPVEPDSLGVSPLISGCLESAAGVNLAGGGDKTVTISPLRLSVSSCVNDLANISYCIAFALWRVSSRGDFQTINTASGTVTKNGQPYLLQGVVRGVARRPGDEAARAVVATQNSNIVQLGGTDGTPEVGKLILENKGKLTATLGELVLPEAVTLEGGFPGEGGTCGETLEPGATCTVMLTVAPYAPAEGEEDGVVEPMALYYSDEAGFDVVWMAVGWIWMGA